MTFNVEMGPIPGMPSWHQQSQPVSYPFPTLAAAERFSENHHTRDPRREIVITQEA